MKNYYLYLLVFVSGAAVLAIEILGTRILGPFYGVSLFLWSALITVTLIALSIGYIIGGRWADQGPTMARLCYLLAAAGAWLLLLPWLKHPVLMVIEPVGLRFAVLAAAFILFTPPLTLLGMVSPYAIRLRAHRLQEVGRTAGDLYAFSTIGSVFAALLTGFILIPNIGVSRLTLGIGLLLLLTALGGLLTVRKSKTQGVVVGILLLIGAGSVLVAPVSGADPKNGVLAVEQSPYAELRVVDVEDVRYMLIDGGTHTMIDLETNTSYFPYVHVLDIGRYLFEKRGNVLLVGLGGGSVASHYASYGWKIDAVEIDPVVADLAYQYFGLKESDAHLFIMDGRQYLQSHPEKYDYIILDAFGSSSIPFHLVTRESFGLIASRLNPGGVLAINIESQGWHDLLVRSLTATLKQHFQNVLALPIGEPPNKLDNLVLLAANRELELVYELPPTEDRFSEAYHKNHAWDNRFEPDSRNAPVLSDDLNPVDLWSERINLAARKKLHQQFGGRGLDW